MSDQCVFCYIWKGKTPTEFLFHDGRVFVIRDKFPKAPIHLLLVPVIHLPSLAYVNVGHESVLGHLFLVAEEMAKRFKVASDGYRLVMNQGSHADMTVTHLHLHLLAGNQLGNMG